MGFNNISDKIFSVKKSIELKSWQKSLHAFTKEEIISKKLKRICFITSTRLKRYYNLYSFFRKKA